MAGPAANVSRSFWAIAKRYSYLLSQQGTPVFDASLNANSQALWWNRLMHGVINSGSYCVRVDGTTEALGVVSEAAAPAQDFRIGMQYGHMLAISSICEYMPDLSGGTRENYAAVTNYLFEGVVTTAAALIIGDTSKNFLTEHYLLVGPCRVYMVDGLEAGNYFPITAWTATSLTCGAGIGTIAPGDTYRVVPHVLAAAGPSTDTVYGMIVQEDLDETEDSDLEDPTTSLTQCHGIQARVCWRVDEGTAGVFPAGVVNRVGYIPVATIARDGTANITESMITNDPQGYFGPSIRAVSMQSLYGTGVSTVSNESRVTDLCEFEGVSGLFDAVDMYKDTNRTIYVKGNGVGGTAYTWAATLDVTGDLEIIVVGDECEIDNSTAAAFMLTTSAGGRVTIRGFGDSQAGFTVTDAGGAGDVFDGSVSIENAFIDGDCVFDSSTFCRNVRIDGTTTLDSGNTDSIFERCTFYPAAGGYAVTATGTLYKTLFRQCTFDGTVGDSIDGGGLNMTATVISSQVVFDTCRFYARGAYMALSIGTIASPTAGKAISIRNCEIELHSAYGSASVLGRGLDLNVAVGGAAVDGLRIFVGHASAIRGPVLSVYHAPTVDEEILIRDIAIVGSDNLTDLDANIGVVRLVSVPPSNAVGAITVDGMSVTGIRGEETAAATEAILVHTAVSSAYASIQLSRFRFEYVTAWNAANKTQYVVRNFNGGLIMTDCVLDGRNTTSATQGDTYGVYCGTGGDMMQLRNCYVGGFEAADFYNAAAAPEILIHNCRAIGRSVDGTGARWRLGVGTESVMTGCNLNYGSWDAGSEPVVEVGVGAGGRAIISNNIIVAPTGNDWGVDVYASAGGCVVNGNHITGELRWQTGDTHIGFVHTGVTVETNIVGTIVEVA